MKLTEIFTKFFTVLFFYIAGLQIANAQTGNIQGRITTSDGQPVAGVTITLKNTKRATISANDGSFTLNKIDAGQHVVIISFVDLKTEERTLTVIENQTIQLDVTLSENSKKLDEVIINSSKNINERTVSSAKLPIANMDLPQISGIYKQQCYQRSASHSCRRCY